MPAPDGPGSDSPAPDSPAPDSPAPDSPAPDSPAPDGPAGGRPRRALLSAYDKTGMVELGRALVDLGWELVSSGGTARVLAEAGLPVIPTAEATGFPEMLGHRVVTLHPAIHGGILADRDDPDHCADMATHGIVPIDLVAVNLYPFTSDPSVELLDIGGPTMVRAAAKNHEFVTVLVDPADYEPVLAELAETGDVSALTRRRLARDAFAHTAAYDAAIVGWFDGGGQGGAGELRDRGPLPPTLHLSAGRAAELRYGENPHQHGARYSFAGDSCWDRAVQHGGKELSYLNVYDADAAWRLVWSLGEGPAAVVIKHANPCGAAVADDITTAYTRAHECDPVSAFGGIVAVNRNVTRAMAEALSPVFTEVLIAPGYDDDALVLLLEKRNLRVLTAPAAEGPGAGRAQHRGRAAGADPRPGVHGPRRLGGGDRPHAHRCRVGRPGAGLEGGGAGDLQHHRAGQGRPGGRHRCRPAEPS